MKRTWQAAIAATIVCVGTGAARADVKGWLDWRGPLQTGVSLEANLPNNWEPGGVNDLWHIDISGGGTPIIAGGKVYALGYQGAGPDLQEVLLCANEFVFVD